MFEWSQPYPSWVYLLLAIGLITLVLIARRLAISARLRRVGLFLPRLGVFALLLWILLNPVKRDEVQLPSEPANVVYLVDCSRSMALDLPVARLDYAKQIIQQVDQQLTGSDRARVHLFRFGEKLSSAADVSQLRATDEASDLSAALKQLPSRFGSDLPRGIVVFSDGTVDASFQADQLASIYQRLKVPVHVFPIGNSDIRGDLAVEELVVPRRVEKGTRVPIRAVIHNRGYTGERVVVNVRATNRPGEEPLATLPLTLVEGSQAIDVVIEANPDLGELVLTVPPLNGEAVRSNNEVSFRLSSTDRKIKVIYMEGTANDEYRWLHDALTEDKDIECVSMYVDHQYVERPRLMRANDPYKGFPVTREELLQYDCVICSDISRGAFTQEQLDWTVELVAERGGGFAMVGGITSFGAGYWDQTVWDKLIPVDMAGGRVGQGWLYHQFHVRVPPDAATHPIWRIVDDPERNKLVIANMPPFAGTNYMRRLKPAATALAYSAVELPNAGIMPVMACESYGRGRTFALAPDTTADWGKYFESQWGEGDNRYFRKFWRNVVRWLTENSVAANGRLLVETDRVIYRPGQTILLSAKAYDDAMQETSDYQLTATLSLGPDEKRTTVGSSVTLIAAGGTSGYNGQMVLPPLPAEALSTHQLAGLVPCELKVVATHGGTKISESIVPVQVLNSSRELLHPQPVPDNLMQLAGNANGRVFGEASELAGTLAGLPSKKGDVLVSRQPIWDQGYVWLVIMGLLTMEWSLRRWAGLA